MKKKEPPLELIPYREPRAGLKTKRYIWHLSPKERIQYKKAAHRQGKPLSHLLHECMVPFVALVYERPERKP